MRLRVTLLILACLILGAGVLHAAEQTGSLTSVSGGDRGVAPEDDGGAEAAQEAEDEQEPAAPGPTALPRPPLAERLATLVADEGLRARTVGVAVTDADGTPVFGHSADTPLLPASTQKLVVAAAALTTLGPDFRYETEVRATAAPEADGVVHGDLVLIGSGDPALASPRYGQVRTDRPRTPLEALADRVAAAGVTHITGGVLGDPRVFPHQPQAPGWLPRYLEGGDTTRSSGLTAEGGRRLFEEGGRLRSEPAADPAATAAATLHGLLTERGITIDGSAGATQAPPAAPLHVGTVTSPPLRDLLRYAVQRSDNHLSDAIFRTVGLAAGDASWAGAAVATEQALSPLQLDLAGAVLADGSGLSRNNRLTPAFLTALDVAMANSSHARDWQSFLAVAGESGTLRRRLVGSVAERRLRGKTGSLDDAVSLSGSVVGPMGDRYHFAVVGNDLDRAGKDSVRQLQDLLVLALAEELYDCRWVTVPPFPEAVSDPPATELRCAA